jgi:hypothetical protein
VIGRWAAHHVLPAEQVELSSLASQKMVIDVQSPALNDRLTQELFRIERRIAQQNSGYLTRSFSQVGRRMQLMPANAKSNRSLASPAQRPVPQHLG